jgi:hypothetical protein
LPDNSFTTVTPHYESGSIRVSGPGIKYKLEHMLFGPCSVKRAFAYDLDTRTEVVPISDFMPIGTETGGGEAAGRARLANDAEGVTSGISKNYNASGTTIKADQEALFTLSPNPATAELNISIAEEVPVQLSIDVMNDKGISVLSTSGISRKATLDLGALPKGIYYIRVVTEHKVEVKKFMKQ